MVGADSSETSVVYAYSSASAMAELKSRIADREGIVTKEMQKKAGSGVGGWNFTVEERSSGYGLGRLSTKMIEAVP